MTKGDMGEAVRCASKSLERAQEGDGWYSGGVKHDGSACRYPSIGEASMGYRSVERTALGRVQSPRNACSSCSSGQKRCIQRAKAIMTDVFRRVVRAGYTKMKP